MACRVRERAWRCWWSDLTFMASGKSPCPRTRLRPNCSSCSRRWPTNPVRMMSRAGSPRRAPTASASRLWVSPPRQRPRADRWPPPRTSVRASPSSPTRTPPSTGSPVRSARRGSPPAAVHEAVRSPGARATPTGRVALPPGAVDVLADLERNSTSPTVGDLLAALIDLAASAAKLGRFEQVLGVISGITRVEEKVSEASGVRRQYTIALRRIYTKPVLEGLSRLLAAPKHRAAAVAALQRGGAAGVEVLMDVLAAAPTVGERRAVFDALKPMTGGAGQPLPLLGQSQWFVGRNVAELIGELGMDDA